MLTIWFIYAHITFRYFLWVHCFNVEIQHEDKIWFLDMNYREANTKIPSHLLPWWLFCSCVQNPSILVSALDSGRELRRPLTTHCPPGESWLRDVILSRAGERNTSLVTGYWKSSAFISGSWQCGRMNHMKEAEGIAFQKWSLKTDYFLSLTPCQGLDTSNIWDVMEPTNHCLPRVSLGLPEDSMLDFSSVFITCCKLLMALICLVIDLSRLDSDGVSDLIEIKNALLDLVEIMGKLLS